MSESGAPPRGQLRRRTAEELRVILARRRMSAAELARRTGLKQSTMARRMTGETAFDLDDLEVIASALGIKVSDLFKADGDTGQATVAKLQAADRPMPAAVSASPGRGSAGRPRDNRPKGRAAGSVPNPATRRPVRLPAPQTRTSSAA
jgi:transcriptional regulator with XRE-family HTH domain